MKTLVFASNNKHKLQEIRAILPGMEIKTLSDIGCFDELPETSPTLKENALEKAQFVFSKYGVNCFADDTGLEVQALDGAPGVYTARYAGPHCSHPDNRAKLLHALEGVTQRSAVFKTVLALILDGETFLFEGQVRGRIATSEMGAGGFGYDPVFIPEGYDQSFAELSENLKNQISHRAVATMKLADFLSTKRE